MDTGRMRLTDFRDAAVLSSCELLFRKVESRTLPRHGAKTPSVEGSVELDHRDDGVLVVRHVVATAVGEGAVEETTTTSYYRIEEKG